MRTLKYLLMLITSLSFAQSKFEKGYLISINGERKECYIKNEDWKSNPSEFVYRLEPHSDSKTGSLKDISEFGIDNYCKYIKATAEIDKTSLDLNNYNDDRTPKFSYETVFLKVLKEGSVSLFSYEETNLHLYFIKGENNKIEQLINKPYKISQLKIGFYQYYRQQLVNSLICDGLNADIEKVEYFKSSLMGLFDKFYKCSGQNVQQVSKDKGKTEIKFYANAGVSLRSYSIERVGENAKADFGSKPCARIGVELEAILPFNHGVWTLFVEPNYETYSFSKKIPTYWNVKIEEKIICIPLGVRRYIPINTNSKLFLNFAYNFMVSRNSKGSYETNNEEFEVYNKSNMVLGLGYAYKKFRIEVRGSINDGTSTSYAHIIPKSKATAFMLAYNFL